MAYVFISHSSKDRDFWARPLGERLKSVGHDVFLDNDAIDWGESITGDLGQAFATLRDRPDAFFLVLLSKNADDSKWVQRECAIAEYLQAGKSYPFVLPVLLPNAPTAQSRFLPFPDRVFVSSTSVDDLVTQFESHRIKCQRRGIPIGEFTTPFMTVSERRKLSKDLLQSLNTIGEGCPARVRHWLGELGERSLEAIEHVTNPNHAIVHTLAEDLRRLSQKRHERLTVFISGFPGLGKTTLSKQLCYQLGPDHCSLIHIESYLTDRSYRQARGLQGDAQGMYDLDKLDRDLTDLISHGRAIKQPTKTTGDYSGFLLPVPPRPIIIVDGALDFIYRLHTSPDVVIFLDGAPLTRLCLSVLRDEGHLPGDRTYSLEDALAKWRHYDEEYYSSTAYIKNHMHVLFQTDIHHRYIVLKRDM